MKWEAFFLLSVSVGWSFTLSLAQNRNYDMTMSFSCPVTVPNGNEPPSNEPPSKSPPWVAERNHEGDSLLLNHLHGLKASFYGNGKLWTLLPPNVTPLSVAENNYRVSARAMQMEWWKGGRGRLTIRGKRLDGPGRPPYISTRGGVNVSPSLWAVGISHETTTVVFPNDGC
jgi:hypothetical protein